MIPGRAAVRFILLLAFGLAAGSGAPGGVPSWTPPGADSLAGAPPALHLGAPAAGFAAVDPGARPTGGRDGGPGVVPGAMPHGTHGLPHLAAVDACASRSRVRANALHTLAAAAGIRAARTGLPHFHTGPPPPRS